MKLQPALLLALALGVMAGPLSAQSRAEFKPGPVFDFAKVAAVPDADFKPGRDTHYKLLFDATDGGVDGGIGRVFDSAARFINMNVAAGVPLDQIKIAIVLHGPGAWDLTNARAFAAHANGKTNGSAAAVAQLIAKGVDIYICGQSAAGLGIAKGDLLPGVKLSLSAMVVDALLLQQGYTLNPF